MMWDFSNAHILKLSKDERISTGPKKSRGLFFVFIQKISIIYYYSEYDDKILGRRGATLLPMFPFIFNTNERGY